MPQARRRDNKIAARRLAIAPHLVRISCRRDDCAEPRALLGLLAACLGGLATLVGRCGHGLPRLSNKSAAPIRTPGSDRPSGVFLLGRLLGLGSGISVGRRGRDAAAQTRCSAAASNSATLFMYEPPRILRRGVPACEQTLCGKRRRWKLAGNRPLKPRLIYRAAGDGASAAMAAAAAKGRGAPRAGVRRRAGARVGRAEPQARRRRRRTPSPRHPRTKGGQSRRRRRATATREAPSAANDDAPASRPARSATRPRAQARRSGAVVAAAAGAAARSSRRLFYWGLVLGLWVVIAVAGVLAWVDAASCRRSSRSKSPSARRRSRSSGSTASRSRTRGEMHGATVTLKELPPYLPHAFIAIEDRRFYSHYGIDPIGLARAARRQRAAPRRVAGRLDHHAAARQEPVPHAGAHALAQAAGGRAGALARAQVQQDRDPRALSQPRLFRRRRLWRRCRRAALFRQAGASR